MLKGAWELMKANREAVCFVLVGLVVLAFVRSIEGRVNARWQGAQATATVAATGRKQVVETAGAQASARIEEKVNADIKGVRRAGADLRERVRGAARAAGRANLPSAAGTAGKPDDPAGGDLVVVEDPALRLRLQLVDVAEEGDVYRVQVLGWQAWWRQVQAAWALGEQVPVKPPDDAR